MDAAASHRSIGPAAPDAAEKLEGFGRQKMTIPADLSRLAEVRRFADTACRAYGFPPDVCYQVRLAMSEAVANAIEHGSHQPRDQVTIEAMVEQGSLVVYVRDTGTFRPRVWRGGPIIGPDANAPGKFRARAREPGAAQAPSPCSPSSDDACSRRFR